MKIKFRFILKYFLILFGKNVRSILAGMIPCAISYDREIADEDERVMQCHDALLQKFLHTSYFPNRLGIQSLHALSKSNHDNECIAKLKKLFYPNDIIAPSKYDFRDFWPKN